MVLDALGQLVEAVDPAAAGHDAVVQEAVHAASTFQSDLAGVPIEGHQTEAAAVVRAPGDAALLEAGFVLVARGAGR